MSGLRGDVENRAGKNENFVSLRSLPKQGWVPVQLLAPITESFRWEDKDLISPQSPPESWANDQPSLFPALSKCMSPPGVIRNPKVGMSNAPKENKGIKSSRSPGTPLGLWFSTSWKAQFIRGRTDWLHMNFLSKRNPLPGSRSSFNLDIHGRKSIQHLQPRCLAAFRVTAF